MSPGYVGPGYVSPGVIPTYKPPKTGYDSVHEIFLGNFLEVKKKLFTKFFWEIF